MTGKLDQIRKGTTTMAILKLLVDEQEPLHGYEIIRRLEARSEGYFRFKEGLIYPSLHRMEQDGLLESRWLGEPGTRRRKVYTVTDEGRRQLEVDVERWQTFSQQMNQLLGLETA
jgi:PadR family transcriptional regulator PadR